MKTITLPVAKRLDTAKKVINSIQAMGSWLDDWMLIVRAEPINNDLIAYIENLDFMNIDFQVNEKCLGINKNTYGLLETAYYQYHADYNLYLEDDTVLSPDTKFIIDFYLDKDSEYLNNATAYCLFNDKGNESETDFYYSKRFMGWGFIMSKLSYDKYARSVWTAGKSMWDNRLAENIRKLGGINVLPELSRIKNIGINGEHFNPRLYKRYESVKVSNALHKKNYNIK